MVFPCPALLRVKLRKGKLASGVAPHLAGGPKIRDIGKITFSAEPT